MKFQIIGDRLEFERELIAFLEPNIIPSIRAELEQHLNNAVSESEFELRYEDGRYDAYEELNEDIDALNTEIEERRRELQEIRDQAREFQNQAAIEFERGYEAGYQQCMRDRC